MSSIRERAAPLAAGVAVAAIAFGAVALVTNREDGPAATDSGAASSTGGQAVFARMGCGGCHRLAAAGSTGEIGPDLDVALGSHTDESLRAQILSPAPGSLMPDDFGARLNEAELDALVAFLLGARR